MSRYHFNIGEGNYRCGIAFDICAGSSAEAVALANQFLHACFYAENRGGSIDLRAEGKELAGASNLRVYVDDDMLATDRDIVTEDPVGDAL